MSSRLAALGAILAAALLAPAANASTSLTTDTAVGAPTGNFFTNVRLGSTTGDFYDGTLLKLGEIAQIKASVGQTILFGASVFGQAPDSLRFTFSDVPGLDSNTSTTLPLDGCPLIPSGGFNCSQGLRFSQAGTYTGTIFVDLLLSNPDYRETSNAALTGNGALFTYSVEVASAVPEPATWLTMLLGFGLVGCAARRSRRRRLLQAA
jgi:hypothetical protein